MNTTKRLKAAITAHRKGKLRAAEIGYREILSKEPEHADALHFLGMLVVKQGNVDKGIALIRKSLEISPINPSAQNNLGNILHKQKDLDGAAEAYGAAIALDPTQAESFQNFGVLLREQGRTQEARDAFTQATALDPKNAEAWFNFAVLLYGDGELEAATNAFEQCARLGYRPNLNGVFVAGLLAAMDRKEAAVKLIKGHLKNHPDDAVAEHILASLTGADVDRASDGFVKNHFDDFAENFDSTLASLQYRAPEVIAAEAKRLLDDGQTWPAAVDLGCGTGLLGPLVKDVVGTLVGVDLSVKMLRKAAETGAYDSIVEEELVAYLRAQPDAAYDVAFSADTLCYFGALENVMAEMFRTLRPGASLIASFEAEQRDTDTGYLLNTNGRYAHRPDYLRTVATDAGLTVAREHEDALRQEAGVPVGGLILTLTRPV